MFINSIVIVKPNRVLKKIYFLRKISEVFIWSYLDTEASFDLDKVVENVFQVPIAFPNPFTNIFKPI